MTDDRELLDQMYACWARTGDDECRWEARGDRLVTVDPGGGEEPLTITLEAASFIAAAHGVMPVLIRRAHEALDEADRADLDRDERECRIAELELELQAVRAAAKG